MKAVLICCLTLLLALPLTPASASSGCKADLDSLPAYLRTNDAGAAHALSMHDAAYFRRALARAEPQAAQARSDADCLQVLNDYLHRWRKTHLRVRDIAKLREDFRPDDAADLPTLEMRSAQTLLLRVPSFALGVEAAFQRMIEHESSALQSHPFWIIDVRRNGGGWDSSYQPLLEWIAINPLHGIGVAWYVTPENIRNQTRICDYSGSEAAQCRESLEPIQQRMRQAHGTGVFISGEETPVDMVQLDSPAGFRKPSKVAVLIDDGCGSSCEQFLLDARQSYNVKLLGRRTLGSLDYSNLRSHELPSGKRVLFYATSRSLRVPGLPLDDYGIQPDLYFDKPKDAAADEQEIERVRQWLESEPH